MSPPERKKAKSTRCFAATPKSADDVDILSSPQEQPDSGGRTGRGQTALVEGLALRIAEGNVPDALKPVSAHP
jgi:hypothetical protein